jgi:hypothetical protein
VGMLRAALSALHIHIKINEYAWLIIYFIFLFIFLTSIMIVLYCFLRTGYFLGIKVFQR